MTTELSEKLRIASLIATLMVVLRHSANWVAFFPKGGAPDWLMDTEWNVLFWTDVAVPFFFFVSGFLFMRVEYLAEGKYFSMLKKKGRALLVPFLIWNLAGALVLLFHDNEGNLGNSFSSCVENLCLSNWYGPLWYVRDIMILMLLYPVYGWLYKRYGQPLLVMLILGLMYFRWHPGWNDFLTGEGLVFFLFGGICQKYNFILENRANTIGSLLAFIIWICISSFISSWDRDIHRICILVNVIAFWFSLDLIPSVMKEACLKLAPYSFLIYVTHFYLHKVFKIGLAHFFPENAVMAIIAFFVVPVITVAIIVAVGTLWKRWHATSYAICMGGR